MKTHLAGLKKGETVIARVAEKLSDFEYIVSISGQLIQVQNHSLEQFQVGSSVRLVVAGVKPLQLQLYVGQARRSKRGIDVSV